MNSRRNLKFVKTNTMKKITLILLIGFISAFSKNASAKGGPEYTQAMKTAVATMDTTKSANGFLQLAGNFERIAGVETAEWLPDYYAAYCYAMYVFIGMDKKTVDDYMDKAEALINKADGLKPDNSEIITVKGLVNGGRIMKDPASRGRKYGTLANDLYEKAKKLDDSNPRPYLLQGQGKFYTPKMFGGGKDKAKPLLQTAVDKYKTFKPESDIAPHWGEAFATMLLSQCNEEK